MIDTYINALFKSIVRPSIYLIKKMSWIIASIHHSNGMVIEECFLNNVDRSSYIWYTLPLTMPNYSEV